MLPSEGFTQFTCPLCGGDRFYLVRHEIDDIEALEMVANGTNPSVANMRRFLLPLNACCEDCGDFNDSVTLIDYALKIGATRWETVIIKADDLIADNTEDEGRHQ